MSTSGSDAARLRRRHVALLLAASAVLLASGCSASGGAAGDTGGVGAAPETAAAADQAGAGTGQEAAAATAGADRMVVKDGQLDLTADDPLAVAAQVATIVGGEGGRVDQRELQAGFEGAPGSALLTVRVPAESLDRTVAAVGALGEVAHYRESTRDVTDAVVDLDARIEAGETSVGRVEQFLAQARDTSELLATERELSQRQADLESLKAQRAALADQVSMSTLSVSISARGGVVVERPGPRTFGDGLARGWDALWAALRGFAVLVGVLLPWAALAGLITAALAVPLRMVRARRTPPAPPAPPQDPLPPAPLGDPAPVGTRR